MTADSKHLVVIGGSEGIGFEIVRRQLSLGAHVTVVSRTPGKLGGDLTQFPGRCEHITADVRTSVVDESMLPEIVDGFVYCPGSINLGSLRSTKPETMRIDFELNVVAAMTNFQVVMRCMNRAQHASAVFFSTVAVKIGIPMHTSIAASKGAIEALVRTWAAELAPKIRVNGIAPALTDTRLSHRLLSSEARREAMAAQYPLGRIGSPNDCAAMADFLLSEQSGWMTGQVIAVDGGLSSILKG